MTTVTVLTHKDSATSRQHYRCTYTHAHAHAHANGRIYRQAVSNT